MILSKLIKLNNFRIKIAKNKLTEKNYLKKSCCYNTCSKSTVLVPQLHLISYNFYSVYQLMLTIKLNFVFKTITDQLKLICLIIYRF